MVNSKTRVANKLTSWLASYPLLEKAPDTKDSSCGRMTLRGGTGLGSWNLWLKQFFVIKSYRSTDVNLNRCLGAPGWLSWLSLRLWLRSRSQGLEIKPHTGLPAQQGVCLRFSLPLPLPSVVHAHACSLCLQNKYINKSLKKKIL